MSSSAAASSSSSPPPTIGPFTIGREIGKGSFAVVHRGHSDAQDGGRRRPVAIKIVTRRKLTQKLLDNLEGEIAILKTVSHPNIVELIDCLKTDSHIYLVMHFSAGGDLSQYIRKKGQLANLDDHEPASSLTMSKSFLDATKRWPHPSDGGLNDAVVRSFLEQLASAMQFMRQRNIVHRDIKPQNLLLQPPDAACLATGHPAGIPQMKVADFGFARSLPAASLAETLCGSPLYMAPEILRYEKYDAKADLWSIGAVTFEMVVGKPPFRASNHVELLRRIERNDDRIRFPDERSETTWLREVEKRRDAGEVVSAEEEKRGPTPVADDLKTLIRGLLKRVPVERLSFDDFFASPVIVGARPAVVKGAASNTDSSTIVPPAPVSPPRPTPGPTLPLQPASSTRVQAPPPLPPMPPLPKFPPKYILSRGESSSTTPTKASTTRPATTEHAASPSPSPSPSFALPPSLPTAPPQEDSDSDSQYVIVDKGNIDSNALAEELSRSPSSVPAARSPLSAQAQGAVSAAARLARRPSRLTKLSSGFSAAVGVTGSSPAFASAHSPTSPSPRSTTLTPNSPRPTLTPLPVAGAGSPTPSAPSALSTSPSAPFALPPGVRRQSFIGRRVSSSSFGADQEKQHQQATPPSSYPTTPASAPAPPPPSSALARALTQASQASQKLFGIPSGTSLLGALAHVRGGSPAIVAGSAGQATASGAATSAGAMPTQATTNAGEENIAGDDAAEQEAQLLLRLDDLGQKAYVLCEFADSKMCSAFGDAWSNAGTIAATVGSASASASSLQDSQRQYRSPSFTGTTIGTAVASPPQYDDALLGMIAAEALQVYVKSLGFLQAGIEAVRAHLSVTPASAAASPRSVGASSIVAPEINEAVHYLRKRFAETMERAESVRNKMKTLQLRSAGAGAAGGQLASPVNVDKIIYDKAMQLARAAAIDELEHQSPAVAPSAVNISGSPSGTPTAAGSASSASPSSSTWDVHACLLAYETAEVMLGTLIEGAEGGGTSLTVQPFIRSIGHRCQILRARVLGGGEGTAAASSGSGTPAGIRAPQQAVVV
ncbi:Pkinase-domain-containing protein [Jaminaea rosea]|uniref:non-specific serine/threonine protein kinase n=1 Tax=Jaminaea rosea TaxID=1569628 RepID=A0A316UY19_9BASI|nr:Pkinase-domain-containing protein [Jaminaea rosea]PWN29201.1 Pkinase-domain-containing protein [Jaminaea rosea]